MNDVDYCIPLLNDIDPGGIPECWIEVNRLFERIDLLVHRWAELTNEWSRIKADAYSDDPSRGRAAILSLHAFFSEMNVWFSEMIAELDTIRTKGSSTFRERAYNDSPIFQSKRFKRIRGKKILFRPHLQQCESPVHEKWEVVFPAFRKRGLTDTQNMIDEGLGALSEDLANITRVASGLDHTIQSVSAGLLELWSLADHSERHCELAIKDLERCMEAGQANRKQ